MRASLTTAFPSSRKITIAVIAAALAGCGSSGSGDGTPAPTVQIEAQPSVVVADTRTTLNWSTTHADSCQASGGWTGLKPASGEETVGPVVASTTFALQCTGRAAT